MMLTSHLRSNFAVQAAKALWVVLPLAAALVVEARTVELAFAVELVAFASAPVATVERRRIVATAAAMVDVELAAGSFVETVTDVALQVAPAHPYRRRRRIALSLQLNF